MHTLAPLAHITAKKNITLRGTKVLRDRDLANLYGVETRTLKQVVR